MTPHYKRLRTIRKQGKEIVKKQREKREREAQDEQEMIHQTWLYSKRIK